MIVMKYGGTSVANAEAMKRIVEIVRLGRAEKLLIVLSACAGMTDRLLRMIKSAASSAELSIEISEEIRSHHLRLAAELVGKGAGLDQLLSKIETLLAELETLRRGVMLLGECTPKSSDRAASYGELLSTTIFEAALSSLGFRSGWADARQIVSTDADFGAAKVDFAQTEKNVSKISQQFENCDVIVTQGFIGSSAGGAVTTLGRGGSDYSAAIFGALLGAEEIQIWTDVEGILTADPRIAPHAVTVSTMSFDEVREMAQFGAKVVHPDTVLPAVERNIPVRVLNTFAPDGANTLIRPAAPGGKPSASSATLKRNCLFVSVKSNGNDEPRAILSQLMEAAERTGARVYCSSIAEHSLRLVSDNSPKLCETVGSILYGKQFEALPAGFIGVTGEMPVWLASRFFSSVAAEISDGLLAAFVGASEWSLPIAVREEFAEKALESVHRQILEFSSADLSKCM